MSATERQSNNDSREAVTRTREETADDGDDPESDSNDAENFDKPDSCRRPRFHALKAGDTA